MSPKASHKDIEAARRLVRVRDGHQCQMCGASIVDRPSALHHRVAKGMGGSAQLERASNLVRLCGNGNADGCHGIAHGNPTWARVTGWIVYRSQDPSLVPLQTFHGAVLLDDNGERHPYVRETG